MNCVIFFENKIEFEGLDPGIDPVGYGQGKIMAGTGVDSQAGSSL